MSTKEQMLRAKSLIQQKRYGEAQKILKKIDHPTAKKWLAKIDRIQSSQKSSKRGDRQDSRSRSSASDEELGPLATIFMMGVNQMRAQPILAAVFFGSFILLIVVAIGSSAVTTTQEAQHNLPIYEGFLWRYCNVMSMRDGGTNDHCQAWASANAGSYAGDVDACQTEIRDVDLAYDCLRERGIVPPPPPIEEEEPEPDTTPEPAAESG